MGINQKGFSQILLLVILLVSITFGAYSLQQKTGLLSQVLRNPLFDALGIIVINPIKALDDKVEPDLSFLTPTPGLSAVDRLRARKLFEQKITPTATPSAIPTASASSSSSRLPFQPYSR